MGFLARDFRAERRKSAPWGEVLVLCRFFCAFVVTWTRWRATSERSEGRARRGKELKNFVTLFLRFFFHFSDDFLRSVVIRTLWRGMSERSEGRARRCVNLTFLDDFITSLRLNYEVYYCFSQAARPALTSNRSQ